jgi:uncharacterized membrane protein
MSSGPLLATLPLFEKLDEAERETLAQQVEVVRFNAGATLWNYGDPGGALYVIRSGEVEIFFKDDTGTRIVLETAGAGQHIGEISLLDGGPRTASAMALTDVEAIRVDRDDLDKLLSRHPTAALDILAATGRRLRQSAGLLRHTASRNVNEEAEDKRTRVQRIADWIAEFSGSIGFLFLHVVWFASWILVNVGWIPFVPVFDPFPYGLLTMVVSLEAIVLSVFVLLSQNRQVAKDRIRSDIEYEVNLKAELEVAHLHEKIDHMNSRLLERFESLERQINRRGDADGTSNRGSEKASSAPRQ